MSALNSHYTVEISTYIPKMFYINFNDNVVAKVENFL